MKAVLKFIALTLIDALIMACMALFYLVLGITLQIYLPFYILILLLKKC